MLPVSQAVLTLLNHDGVSHYVLTICDATAESAFALHGIIVERPDAADCVQRADCNFAEILHATGNSGKKMQPVGFGVSGRKSHGDFYKVLEKVGVVMDIKESDILHSLILKGQATNFLKFGDELHKHYVCLLEH